MIIGKGPRHERETIVNFNEADDTMSIWTASEQVYRRLVKAGFQSDPNRETDRSAVFVLPKSSFRFPKLPSEARVQRGRELAAARKAKLLKPV